MNRCGRCKRPIVSGSRCENCKVKDKADRIKKAELRDLDKQSKKTIKSLGLGKLSSIFSNYSTYAQNYKQLFKRNPTFEEYESALRNEKIKLAHEEADKLRHEKSAKKHREMPDENEGREPYLGREPQPQYERETESYEGANAWGESTYSNDKPKRSIQDVFRDLDPAHSELE